MKKLIIIVVVSGVLIPLIFLLFIIMPSAFLVAQNSSQTNANVVEKQYAYLNVSEDVLKWKPTVEEYAQKHDMGEYVDLILAVMMQESGGRYSDLMQCSESGFNTKYSNSPNSITDSEYSIDIGIQTLKSSLDLCNGDIKTALQCYNYGPGFALYVGDRGGQYSQNLASEFSIKMAKQMGWGGYGDPFYVDHVFRYYIDSAISSANNNFIELMSEAVKHEGKPYKMQPVPDKNKDGVPVNFDCSSLVQYCFRKALNLNLPRTAQEQYEFTKRIPLKDALPGDLIFYKNTYNSASYITHVSIYVGDNMVFEAGDPVGYSSLDTQWAKEHVVCAGRVKEVND